MKEYKKKVVCRYMKEEEEEEGKFRVDNEPVSSIFCRVLVERVFCAKPAEATTTTTTTTIVITRLITAAVDPK